MVNVSLLSDRLGMRTHVTNAPADEEKREPILPEGTTARGLSIAISRETGTPGSEVAREVGARLGWPVYDHELLEAVSKQMDVPLREVESIDERGRGWLLETIEGFALGSRISEGRYVHLLVSIMRTLSARGHCVIVGRGAALILPAESTLRVRLVGELEDRIAAESQRLHLGHDEAARRLQQLGKERNRFIRSHFHENPATTSNYDLVLNTSRWSPPACAALIEQALLLKSQTSTAETARHARSGR
jgi:cytidylate kinase